MRISDWSSDVCSSDLAAYELEKAGYQVKILEFQDRPGGRNYTLRGGDSFTESDGTVQKVQFAPGNYINPGPWRIPHHHNRSEARREGKECVRKCRSRWAPTPTKKNNRTIKNQESSNNDQP